MTDFIHLRVHSAYSLSRGAIKMKDLFALCKKNKMPAVGVTDFSNLFGTLEFAYSAVKEGIQPIIGCSIPLIYDNDARNVGQIALLVQTEEGYQNLLKIMSRAHLDPNHEDDIEVRLSDFEGLTEGLIMLTGGTDGALGEFCLSGRKTQAEEFLLKLKALFPDRLYIELMRHKLRDQEKIEDDLIDLAMQHNVPLVATNDTYFAEREFYEAHDALMCIGQGTTVDNQQRDRVTRQHYFKSSREMTALFKDIPEAIQNTVTIAKRCSFFPEYKDPILPPFPTEGGRSEVEELEALTKEGLEERLIALKITDETERKKYFDRMDYELGIIKGMGFPGYFLIVSDFIIWSKENDIPVGPGRGSGAGSVVAWALKITDLDPLRFGLLFERFLNPERVSMPDFDVDFCQDGRDKVITYVQEKYGADRVAQIITFGKLQARAALRDVGRVLAMPYGQVDRLCKMIPNNPANPMTLHEAITSTAELRVEARQDPTVEKLLDVAQKLEGLYRHASTHAAGLVIGDRPLEEIVPLYRDPSSPMPVTQYNMKYVESASLIKFDFLGLKTLTVLAEAVRLIEKHKGDVIDLSLIPLDDTKTFDYMKSGKTVGVFQLESQGMRDVIKKMQPDRFEDIIALVALYRPGPMDNIPLYISVKQGDIEADYLHPSLEPILKETYGIMIYQEQVMQIAQVLAGYTLGGADILRRAMGKKDQAEMDRQRKVFIEGAGKNDVPAKKADEIFDQVNKFAGYGFNKSHAAAYALIAYQTAYLKANYPVEFMAASMTLDLGNTDKLAIFAQDLGSIDIPLLQPDINHSFPKFSVEKIEDEDDQWGVRYALAAVKNVGEKAMDDLVNVRTEGGKFTGITEFARRIDNKSLNKRQIEHLVSAGAFDCLHENRAQTYTIADKILQEAARTNAEKNSSQVSLFGGDSGIKEADIILPKCDDWNGSEKLDKEFTAIGFYLSSHPLKVYETVLERLNIIPSSAIEENARKGKKRLKLAGIVTAKKVRKSQKGSMYAFVGLSDMAGNYEIMVFSETLTNSGDLLEVGTPLLIHAEARLEEDSVRLTVSSVEPLNKTLNKSIDGIKIHVEKGFDIVRIQKEIAKSTGNLRGFIHLTFMLNGRSVTLNLGKNFSISPDLKQNLLTLPHVEKVLDAFA
ncbi:MAG: DNA polymerase III subunit alpha [Alphaproteobacteria bacterium]